MKLTHLIHTIRNRFTPTADPLITIHNTTQHVSEPQIASITDLLLRKAHKLGKRLAVTHITVHISESSSPSGAVGIFSVSMNVQTAQSDFHSTTKEYDIIPAITHGWDKIERQVQK